MTACAVSAPSNAPRGADSRYTTDFSRSEMSSVGVAVPRSATFGRGSMGGGARRRSTRPRIVPPLRPCALAPASFSTKGRKESTKVTISKTVFFTTSEPIDKLDGRKRRRRHASAVARVVLQRQLRNEVALNRIAAADLDAPDRRFPALRPRRADDVVEAEVVDARRDIQTGPDFVPAFDVRRLRRERLADHGHAQAGQLPLADR